MKIRSAICGLLLLPPLLSCGAADDGEELAAPPVVIANVELRDLEERIDATGELVAKEEAQIASEVSGRITEILVDEGEAVEAGQVLLEIDPERRNLELADARAGLTEAGWEQRIWDDRVEVGTFCRAPAGAVFDAIIDQERPLIGLGGPGQVVQVDQFPGAEYPVGLRLEPVVGFDRLNQVVHHGRLKQTGAQLLSVPEPQIGSMPFLGEQLQVVLSHHHDVTLPRSLRVRFAVAVVIGEVGNQGRHATSVMRRPGP